MINKSVVSSAKFLKMPAETQALYFHLCINSDDDGVCEAYTIMRLLGTSEDNIRILNSKGFINVLNEDLVTYITDRNYHNKIRSDRKIDSLYKKLLLQVIPSIDLVQPKKRSDVKNPSNVDNDLVQSETHGQSTDGQNAGNGQLRLGKVRLGKVSIGKDNLEQKTDEYSSSFLEFWKEYPNKKSKFKSSESYEKVIKHTDPSILLDACKKYALSNKGKEKAYIAHASTRLNQKRREDEDIDIDPIIIIKEISEYEHGLGEYLHHLFYLGSPLFDELTSGPEGYNNLRAEATYRALKIDHLKATYPASKRQEYIHLRK